MFVFSGSQGNNPGLSKKNYTWKSYIVYSSCYILMSDMQMKALRKTISVTALYCLRYLAVKGAF